MSGFKNLNMAIFHVLYSPGSNIGDLYWIWQCTAVNIDDALKIYNPIIENLKNEYSTVPHMSYDLSYLAWCLPIPKSL